MSDDVQYDVFSVNSGNVYEPVIGLSSDILTGGGVSYGVIIIGMFDDTHKFIISINSAG